MGLFSKALVAIFFAMGAVVLYRAVLSLRLDSRIDPERILAVAVALGSASIYGGSPTATVPTIPEIPLPGHGGY